MNPGIIIIIVLIAILLFYVIFKPYFVKYDTTLAFTGGLGAGKTLNAVKTATRLYKKTRFNIRFNNWIHRKLNKIIVRHNKRVDKKILQNKKHTGKYWNKYKIHEIPKFISNIPVIIYKKKHKPIYSTVLTKDMLLLKERIPEYSIVLIDELPQLVNQFNWNETEVQNNLNEFITFFRHYIGGYFIVTAQSIDDVVSQIRRKLNTYYWLFDYQKFLWKFYKVRICQFQSSDIVSNVNQGFIEENSKWIYGTLFTRKYDSRCYSGRYTFENEPKYKRFAKIKTNKIIRFSRHPSPLDKENQE